MHRPFYPGRQAMHPSKRETVLETAERLFYEEGFHATGIDRVVTTAGVARMTLYNHFPSKEALVESVLERRSRRYLDDLRGAVAARGRELKRELLTLIGEALAPVLGPGPVVEQVDSTLASILGGAAQRSS